MRIDGLNYSMNVNVRVDLKNSTPLLSKYLIPKILSKEEREKLKEKRMEKQKGKSFK